MLKRIALIFAMLFILIMGYTSYMVSQYPYYLDCAVDAAINMKSHPSLKYGKPPKAVLINSLGYPCIPYRHLRYNPYRYSKWIVSLQRHLNAYHGFKIKVDGRYGYQTMRAVGRVKTRYGLPSKDGYKVDYTTWYVICTQKSKEGNRFRLSGPNNTYWKSHNLVYYKYKTRTYVPKVPKKKAYFPVTGKYRMYNNWNAPRPLGRRHKGIDIAAPRGRQLVAIYSGRITLTRSLLGGKSLWINASNGGWYYAHMKSYAVKNGQYVKAGQVVGWVGSSGLGVTGPHLHLGWKKGGRTSRTWHNPYYILKSLQ